MANGVAGAPFGNDNKRTGKMVADVVRKIAVQEPELLYDGVMAQFRNAQAGDLAALTFVRDTLDGRPAQQLNVSGDNDAPLVNLIRVMVINPDAEPRVITHDNGEQSLTLPAAEEKRGEEILAEAPPLPHPRQVIVAKGDGSE